MTLSRPMIACLLSAWALPLSVAAKDTGLIFVSSEKDHVVTVLDGESYEVVKEIKTAERPRHLQFNPERTLIYAACGDGAAVDIIDVEKLEVVDQIEDIDDPEAFDLSLNGKLMYMSLEDEGALGVIDLDSKKLVRQIEVGEEPEGVLTSRDGKSVYVTSEVANMVHVVDTESWEAKADIRVGNRPRRFAMTPNDAELWVSNELGGSVSIINPATNEVTEEIKFEPKGFRPEDVTPVGITMTEDGKTTFVALGRANHVARVDTASREIKDYILVGTRAWNTVLNRDNSLLFVANGLSDDVSIIDVEKGKVIKSVPVGRVPYMVLIDD